jgi:hypothetical protein
MKDANQNRALAPSGLPIPMEEHTMTTTLTQQLKMDAVTVEEVAAIAARLEQDEYPNAFEGLQDWHLLRSIAFQRPDLVEPYLYLLDLEAYDES